MDEKKNRMHKSTRQQIEEIIGKLKHTIIRKFEYIGDFLKFELYKLIFEIWRQENLLKKWEKASIIPIEQNGHSIDNNNFRGIFLLDVVYKVLATLIKINLEPFVEAIGENQAGFRKGKATTDQV